MGGRSIGLRDNCTRRHLSKETVVQGDMAQGYFCPRKLSPVRSFLKSIQLFSFGYCHINWVNRMRKDYLNSYPFFKLISWTKLSLDKCIFALLGCLWNIVPWTKISLENCPLAKCINTPPSGGEPQLYSIVYLQYSFWAGNDSTQWQEKLGSFCDRLDHLIG